MLKFTHVAHACEVLPNMVAFNLYGFGATLAKSLSGTQLSEEEGNEMTSGITKITTALLAVVVFHPAWGAIDQFSRANCFHNETMTLGRGAPKQWRGVWSWHFKNGIRQHYVTPNLPYWPSCVPGVGGYTMVGTPYGGLNCNFFLKYDDDHKAIHSPLNTFATDDYSDGILVPFVSTDWRVDGVQTIQWPGPIYIVTYESETDCNNHLDQWY